jgi:DNA-binding GntR family transcriptional regulator
VNAPSEVAERLGGTAGEPVVVRRRVMYMNGVPTELTDTYYPLGVARGTPLAGTRKIPGGAVTLLAEMGYRAAWVHEEVYARMPDAGERDELALGEGQPVLCMTRVSEDGDGKPFQVDVSVFPAARQRLRYDMKVD